ncbi:MAG: 30S ribosomal protein S18 [Patescibacteria group bacterium]
MISHSKQKQCYFCASNSTVIDFKNTDTLRKFIAPQAQIIKKARTGTCSLHQRMLSNAIKKARFLGLVPFVRR